MRNGPRWKPTTPAPAARESSPGFIAKNLSFSSPASTLALHRRHRATILRPASAFARPQPRLQPAPFSPFENALLIDLQFGITQCRRPRQRRADELTDDELRAAAALEPKSKRWRPTSSPYRNRPLPHVSVSRRPARLQKGHPPPPRGGATPGLPNPSGTQRPTT